MAGLKRETGEWAYDWNEAAEVEAEVKGITKAEVLAGKLNPALAAARARNRRAARCLERQNGLRYAVFAVALALAALAFSVIGSGVGFVACAGPSVFFWIRSMDYDW